MLNALWVVLWGLAAIFIIQGVLYLVILLMKKLLPPAKNQGGQG